MFKIHHGSSSHDYHSRGKSIRHTRTLAAGPDVKVVRLKPAGRLKLIHLFTTLQHTDQTLCVQVCSLHRTHTRMPTHNQLFGNAAHSGLWGSTLRCAVGAV